MPIFYGLYVENERLAAAFDIIRFFCEPNFFRRTHITVRGPYPDNYTLNLERGLREQRYEIFLLNLIDFLQTRVQYFSAAISRESGGSGTNQTLAAKSPLTLPFTIIQLRGDLAIRFLSY
jgi:hypothetical protein